MSFTGKQAYSSCRPLLGRYKIVPGELFRVGATAQTVLRDFDAQHASGHTSYDLHLGPDGLVHPKLGPNWEGPNGASMRPNGPMMQEIIRNFNARDTTIYRLPQGLEKLESLSW